MNAAAHRLCRRTSSHKDDGTALVEFAIVLPVFALMLFAMLQFGMAFAGLDQLRAQVQLATRAAATGDIAACTEAGQGPACVAAIEADIGAPAGADGKVNVLVSYDASSHYLQVCASYVPEQFTQFIDPITVRASSAYYTVPQFAMGTQLVSSCG
jgi:Flp pilus assembly protein TadG